MRAAILSEQVLQVGDVVLLKKPHPCGAVTWTVIRLGSDVVLYNADCDRKITLTRSKLNKNLKRILPKT